MARPAVRTERPAWCPNGWLARRPLIIETFFTREEAADYCRISVPTFSAMVDAKLLPAPLSQGWFKDHLDRAAQAIDPLKFDRNAYFSQVYFIECEQFCKIGFSGCPQTRMAGLQESNPFELRLLYAIRGDHTIEQRLHVQFAHLRIKGEWFEKTPELLAYIEWLKGNDIK